MLLGLAAGTIGAYVVAAADEREGFDREADALAAEATEGVRTAVTRATDLLRGSSALVAPSGSVDVDAFEAFGEDVLGSVEEGIALGLAVSGEERDGFERMVGQVRVRTPDGSFRRAPPAPEHFPLVRVVAPDVAARGLVGWDYATDPVRADAVRRARDSATAVLSAPTSLSPTGAEGFLVVAPLFDPDAGLESVGERRGAFVGYLTVAYPAAELIGTVVRQLPPGTTLHVRDGSSELLAVGRTNDELESSDFVRRGIVDVAGRTWILTTRPAGDPARALPLYILGSGAAAEVGLIVVFLVTWRYQRRMREAFRAERQSQQRSETLENLAARLSRSLSGAEVGQALLEQLPPFTGTTAGAVLLLDDESERLHLLAADGYRPAQLAAFAEVDLSARSAVADAVHRGEPAWLPSPLAWRDDPITSSFGSVGRAAAIVPLVADRRVVGVMVLVHPGVRSFYEDERSLLTTVAALAARALNRARRYDAEHDAAVVLQRALLPAVIPEVSDVSVALRYLPATGGLAVGGDWYDVFALGDGRIGVVVGDVVGRGVKAAAAMGRLRSALRALAEVLPEPAALLRAFERHVPDIPDALCATMVYAVVDPAAGRLSYVRAGHPPPLLVRRDGAELLDGAVSPPLGVTGGTPATAVTLAIEPGDTLVLYTDGIVERRGEPVTAGLERLRSVGAAAAGLDAEACCDRIVAELLGDEGHADDAAVVVVRLEGVATTLSPGIASPDPTTVRS